MLQLMLMSCSIALVGTSRAEQWVRTYGGEGSYAAQSAQLTTDGGYVVAGNGPEGLWVLKLDVSGNAVWRKVYGGASVASMVAAPDGGYVVAGAVGLPSPNTGDGMLMKLDPNGGVVWQKIYVAGYQEEIRSVARTADGGYLMVGQQSANNRDGWLAKVDSLGNLAWQKLYQIAGETYLRSGLQTADGGYVVVGATFGNGPNAGLVMRLGATGNVIWQKSYRGMYLAQSVELANDAGFVVAGNSGLGGWLAKLDAYGGIVWQKTYGGIGLDSVRPVRDGTHLLKGYIWGNRIDAVLLNVDTNGEVVWVRTYGGTGDDQVGDFQVTADGGYLLVGGHTVAGAAVPSAWMLKVDANGELSGCPFTGTLNLVASDASVSVEASAVTAADFTAAAIPREIGQADSLATLRRQCPFTGLNPSGSYQGLWWKSPADTESGWGINFAHQGEVIFATWYTYDLGGKAWWLTMSASQNNDNTFSGALYQTIGPPFDADPFNPDMVTRTSAGFGVLTFSDANNGSFTYTVNGVSQAKAITRQQFDRVPTCVWGVQANPALATNYQDLWWVLDGVESGWGVNFTHQGDIIFATWFTYNFDGAPLWLSATAYKTSAGIYSGTLYRTTGPAFNALPFDPNAVTRTPVGALTLTFADGNRASFAYTVRLPGAAPVSQTKQITRQVFRTPGTVCQ